MIKINKLTLNNFRFFTDDKEHNSFELNGQNMLVYGENGSGKSSLFRAFEFLAKTIIEESEFNDSKNIFKLKEETFLEFEFDNDETLRIDRDHLSLGNGFTFIEKLSLPRPILDYKSLLKVHYRTTVTDREVNLYTFFEALLKEYPIEQDVRLKDLRGEKYFNALERIITEELFDDINLFLREFNQGFKLLTINCDAFEREIILNIEYFNKTIGKYHHFLNEARLSALAISVYFAIIKKQFSYLLDDSLKVLILDDLLISLDMSNRLKLIDILKSEFSNFQIFFFTHDKPLFDVFKEKMNWKAYEIYVDEHEENYEKPFIKPSLDYFESAIKHFEEFDYPACANYLRKEVERLKTMKEKAEASINNDKKVFKKIKKMLLTSNLSDRDGVHRKLIGFKKGLEDERDSAIEIDLRAIKSITDRILNPQSHDDTSKPLYKKELEEAIAIIGKLREGL